MPSVQMERLAIECPAAVGGRLYWSEGVSPSNALPPEAGDLNRTTAGGVGSRVDQPVGVEFSGLASGWPGFAP